MVLFKIDYQANIAIENIIISVKNPAISNPIG